MFLPLHNDSSLAKVSESSANDGKSSVCDINFVNLSFVSDVQVIKEVTNAPPTPHSLSINMVCMI